MPGKSQENGRLSVDDGFANGGIESESKAHQEAENKQLKHSRPHGTANPWNSLEAWLGRFNQRSSRRAEVLTGRDLRLCGNGFLQPFFSDASRQHDYLSSAFNVFRSFF